MSIDSLPTIGPLDECGPNARPEAPTYRSVDPRISDWIAGEAVDWNAETVGPLTAPRPAPSTEQPPAPLPFPTQETT
jgi:hypothetical protein